MKDLSSWKLRGPVHILRKEHAEWDEVHNVWLPPRNVAVATFRPDRQLSEQDTHNADGSISRWTCSYDADGRLLEEQWRTNDEPPFRIVTITRSRSRLFPCTTAGAWA